MYVREHFTQFRGNMYYDKNYSWISNLFHQIKLAILCELLEVPFQTKGKPEYKRGVLHMITLAFHIGKRRMRTIQFAGAWVTVPKRKN